MKRWEKWLKDRTQKIEKLYEYFAKFGSCGKLRCCDCMFSNSSGMCNVPDNVVTFLNEEEE